MNSIVIQYGVNFINKPVQFTKESVSIHTQNYHVIETWKYVVFTLLIFPIYFFILQGEGDDSLDREDSDDEDEEEDGLEPPGFLLNADGDPSIQGIPPDAQARLEAFFEAAGTDLQLISISIWFYFSFPYLDNEFVGVFSSLFLLLPSILFKFNRYYYFMFIKCFGLTVWMKK